MTSAVSVKRLHRLSDLVCMEDECLYGSFEKEHYFSRALLQESLGFVGLFCKRDVCLQGSVEKKPYFGGALLQKSPGFVGFFRERYVGL